MARKEANGTTSTDSRAPDTGFMGVPTQLGAELDHVSDPELRVILTLFYHIHLNGDPEYRMALTPLARHAGLSRTRTRLAAQQLIPARWVREPERDIFMIWWEPASTDG